MFDVCVYQWTLDPSEMLSYVDDRWELRLRLKEYSDDPLAGAIMPSEAWYHAFWNEDAPGDADGDYTESDVYRTPEALRARLDDRGVDGALLLGHEITYVNGLLHPEYAAEVAAGYNRLLVDEWLPEASEFYGAIVLPMDDPRRAVEEIDRLADDDRMVAALVYGGTDLPLGHRYYEPVYEELSSADLPLIVHTSGQPTNRQTSLGRPEHYVTYETNLVQNHMTNFVSMVFQGVFDRHPDLDVVWAGQGAEWILHPAWRATRYYRNAGTRLGAPDLQREPHEYLESNCYTTTYPMGEQDRDAYRTLVEMVGEDNVLYGSGYPLWNADSPAAADGLDERILSGNAADLLL
ncbi:hypothetical protein BRC81_05560 [Halobacteriales archaeon QS_1_68_20]|nr:MAG: hypothetical protein BRC81_05560 [Halobacteriales archaeon QS_1_68_20]